MKNRLIRSFTFWKQKALEEILANQDLILKQNIEILKRLYQNKKEFTQLKDGTWILLENVTGVSLNRSINEKYINVYIEREYTNYTLIEFEKDQLDEAIKYRDELIEKIKWK